MPRCDLPGWCGAGCGVLADTRVVGSVVRGSGPRSVLVESDWREVWSVWSLGLSFPGWDGVEVWGWVGFEDLGLVDA